MKKILLFLFLNLLVIGNYTSPKLSLAAVDEYNLIALQHQLQKAKKELSRMLAIQSKDMKKELERLKREIERIYKEIEEELKKAQVTIQEEDRNLKQYLVKFKFEVEQIKVEIDTSMKFEKIKAEGENELSMQDISQSSGLWKKITSENASSQKSIAPPTKQIAQPVATVKIKQETAPEKAKPSEPANKANEKKVDPAIVDESKPVEDKLNQFGADIVKIKEGLANNSGNARNLWVSLAKINLEAERFLKSLDAKERRKYINSDQFALGSYEVAILSIKRALASNANDPDLNFMLGEVYDEINDGLSASNYAEVAKRLYKKKGKYKQAAKAGEYARTLQKKYNIPQESACGFGMMAC
jgi:tetratricopeptide (TPR) repeat protein